jgi:spermidine/putrescine transport system substrate-binding protein
MSEFDKIMSKGLGRRSLLQALGATAVGISFTGLAACSKEAAKEPTKSAATTRIAATGEEPKLNFYNWDTYIGETTLADFKGLGGAEVNMTLFASNDELFAKLRAGNAGYDVIVPSNDFVERMAAADMLSRWTTP